MRAIRLSESNVDTDFTHIEHMYSGRLARYYYKRFDMVLNEVDFDRQPRVLDLGGGTGVFTLSLIEHSEEVYFIDIDREKPPFNTAKTLLTREGFDESAVNFILGDGMNLPLEDNSLDVVFALDVLEHIPNQKAAIREIARVLSKGGTCVVSAPVEVGPVLLIREFYRTIDGNRRQTQGIPELIRSTLGSPPKANEIGHRGYDYRQTRNYLKKTFSTTSTQYCPIDTLKLLNPTCIITAKK